MENVLNCGPYGWLALATGALVSGVLILASVALIKDLVSRKATPS